MNYALPRVDINLRHEEDKPRKLKCFTVAVLLHVTLASCLAMAVNFHTPQLIASQTYTVHMTAAPHGKTESQPKAIEAELVKSSPSPEAQSTIEEDELVFAKALSEIKTEPMRKQKPAPAKKPIIKTKITHSKPTKATQPSRHEATFTKASHESNNGQHTQSIPITGQADYRTQPAMPEYPRRSIRLGQQGTVMVQALIAANGRTKDIRIAKSSAYPLLDQAAVEAVAKWEFLPAHQNGEAILSWIQVPVEFRLQ